MSHSSESDLSEDEFGFDDAPPFAIISPEERFRYFDLLYRGGGLNPPRSLDFGIIENLELRKALEAHCRTLGFQKFLEIKYEAYEELTLQFYTTFNFHGGDGDDDDDGARFTCRLMGKNVTVTCQTLRDIFGFHKGVHKTVPKEFDPVGFWDEITDGRGDFKNGKASSGLIKDPVLLLMHRYICHVVFGRVDSSKVAVKDLFYLSCLGDGRGDHVDTPSFLMANFNFVVTNKRANMCLGNLITAITVHFGTFDPLVDTGMKVCAAQALHLTTNKKAFKAAKEEASSSSAQADGGEDNSPAVAIEDQPTGPSSTVDSRILISCKLEQVKCALHKESADLKKVESNGTETVEDLKREILEANKTIEKLRMEKLESDKAAEMYKTSLEKCLLRVKKVEEGHAKISSMKVGGDLANLVNDIHEHQHVLGSSGKGGNQGSSLVDDDTKDVAFLSPGVHLTSNSSGSKSKGVSEKAARDMIEILDNDDETNRNGAAETSKRVLGSDKVNLVQRTKRNKTEGMGNLFPFSTTKSKKA